MKSDAEVFELGEALSRGLTEQIVKIQRVIQARYGVEIDVVYILLALAEKCGCQIDAEILTQGCSETALQAIQFKDGKLVVGDPLRALLFPLHVKVARETQQVVSELKRAHGVEDDEEGGDGGTH